MLTAKLHVQIAFMMQRAEGDGLIVGQIETLEEVEDQFDGEDIEEINVDDITAERLVVELAESSHASAYARDEVWSFEPWDVFELGVDCPDDAGLLQILSLELAQTLE